MGGELSITFDSMMNDDDELALLVLVGSVLY